MRQEERTLITRYRTGWRGKPDPGGSSFRFLRCPPVGWLSDTIWERNDGNDSPVWWRKKSGDTSDSNCSVPLVNSQQFRIWLWTRRVSAALKITPKWHGRYLSLLKEVSNCGYHVCAKRLRVARRNDSCKMSASKSDREIRDTFCITRDKNVYDSPREIIVSLNRF